MATDPQTKQQEVLSFFANHLLAIFVNVDLETEEGERRLVNLVWSATCIEIKESIVLVTAGHCMEELAELRRRYPAHDFTTYVADQFGDRAKYPEPIPIDLDSLSTISRHEDGLDFGAIRLDGIYADLIRSNGIRPITEENWIRQYDIEYQGFALLGFPAEMNEVEIEDGSRTQLSMVQTTMQFLHPSDETWEHARDHRRFTSFVPERGQTQSIKGMSGGPIIAFATEDQKRYWLIAIQSSWLSNTRQLFATPILEIIPHLEQWITDAT